MGLKSCRRQRGRELQPSLCPCHTPTCSSAACWGCRLGRVRVRGDTVHAPHSGNSDVSLLGPSLYPTQCLAILPSCWPPHMSARHLEVATFTQNLAFMNLPLFRYYIGFG